MTAIVGLFLLTDCSIIFDPATEDVALSLAPDRRVLATLSQMEGRAVSYAYSVELYGPLGRPEEVVRAAILYGARRSACAYGVDMAWRDSSTLMLRYKSAWKVVAPASVRIDKRSIRVIVQPGHDTPGAPCGAMPPLPLP